MESTNQINDTVEKLKHSIVFCMDVDEVKCFRALYEMLKRVKKSFSDKHKTYTDYVLHVADGIQKRMEYEMADAWCYECFRDVKNYYENADIDVMVLDFVTSEVAEMVDDVKYEIRRELKLNCGEIIIN